MSWFRRALGRSSRLATPPVRRAPRTLSDIVRLDDRIAPAADLSISVAGPLGPVTAGTSATFTYTISNAGPDDATNVSLDEVLPAGFTFVSISQTINAGDPLFTLDPDSDNTVSSTVANFPATKQATIVVTAKVNANVTSAAALTRDVIVTADNEGNAADNKSNVVISLDTSADLTLTLTTPPAATVTAGTEFSYTYTVANVGPSDAQSVTLSELLPSDLTFVSIAQTGGSAIFTLDGNFDNTITNSIATFPAGTSAIITVTAKVNPNTAITPSITWAGKVQSTTADPAAGNNEANVAFAVATKADLGITIVGPLSGGAGDQLTYTVTIANSGPSDAQSVNFTNTLSSKLSFVSKSLVTGSTLPGVVPASGKAVYAFVVNVAGNAPNGNQTIDVDVTSPTNDPNAANNNDDVTIAIEARSLTATVAAGVLTINDAVGRDNDLTISRVGANLVITDATQRFQTPLVGILSNGNQTLTIPVAGITSVRILTESLDDTLTINTATALGTLIQYDGGSGFDSLVVSGGNGKTVTSNFTNATSGSVAITGGDTVAYTGLEPVLLNFGNLTDYIFNLPAIASAATLEDGAAAGTTKLTGATFEDTEFTTVGVNSITINRGTTADTLSIRSLPDFAGSLTVGDAAVPFATVTVSEVVTTLANAAVHANAIAINSNVTTAGNLTLNAGDSLTFATGTTTTVPAGKSFATAVGGHGSLGGTMSFVGANFVAPAGVTITGGPNADSIRISKTTAAIVANGGTPIVAPGDTLIVDGTVGNAFEYRSPSTFSLGGGGLVTFANFETMTFENVTTYNVIGTGGNDKLTLNENAGLQAQFTLNADPTVILPAGISTFGFFGGIGNDTMFVTATNAGIWPVASVNFDGEAGNDGLSLNGKSQNDQRHDVTLKLAPLVGNLGRGTAQAGGTTLTFNRLEPIDLFGSDDASMTFEGSTQTITVSEGKDFFQGGATAALRIEGKTDGLDFETVAAWGNASLKVNTVSAAPGVDTVTITGAANAHANSSLRLATDTVAGSIVSITGPVVTTNDVIVNTTEITISANVTATAGQIDLTHTGKLTLGNVQLTSGTTFAQSTGETVILDGKSATIQAGGHATFGGLVNGPGSLVVNSEATGTFAKDVGTTRLQSLTTNNKGTTAFQGAFVKTKADQSFGDDVTFATGGFRFDSQTGSLNFTGTVNPTVGGNDVVLNAPAGNITHTSAVGDAQSVGTYHVENAINVSLNGLSASQLRQSAGTGTTTVGGAVTLSGATPGAADFKTGGAINLNTNKAAFTGTVIAKNGPVVLQLSNGATQPSGSLATTQLYLTGAGSFAIDQKANALNGDGKGEVFAKLTSGSIEVSDSSDLRLEFFDVDVPTPAISIAAGDRNVTLSTSKNLNAGNTTKLDATLIDVTDKGVVQLFFGITDPGLDGKWSGRVETQVTAKTLTVGLPRGLAADVQAKFGNAFIDSIRVRPQIASLLTVNGNDPHLTPTGDSLSLNLTGIPSVNSFPAGPGAGSYTFPAPFQKLTYESIESISGTQATVFTVQTGPNSTARDAKTFEIRVNYFIGASVVPTKLSGNSLPTNPFVVAPELVDNRLPFGSPSVSFANISGPGSQDLVIAAGPSSDPIITVVRGSALLATAGSVLDLTNLTPDQIVAQFVPFENAFRGGFDIAAADFNGDGKDELVVGAGETGGPRVTVFQIAGGTGTIYSKNSVPFNFFPYEESFRGGVKVAAADVNGDGTPDIVAGAGVGGGPRVRIYDGKVGPAGTIADFFAYDASYRGGVNVTGGRFTDHATRDQVITAPGLGGGPHIRVFDGLIAGGTMNPIRDFFAWSPGSQIIPTQQPNNSGVGEIALGTSTTNDGRNRSLLVTRPRGQEFEIVRFSYTPISVDSEPNYQNALAGDFNFDGLIDGGTVGGIAN